MEENLAADYADLTDFVLEVGSYLKKF